MKIDKTQINKILLITLSNIGDIVLTIPVLRVLGREFQSARISVLVGINGREIFGADPMVTEVIVYDKHSSLLEKTKIASYLRKQKFDIVVDLRSTILPLLLGARYNTSILQHRDSVALHRKDKHLNRLSSLGIPIGNPPFYIATSDYDRARIGSLLERAGIVPGDDFVVVAPGAKSHLKRWTEPGFKRVCERLYTERGLKILLVGDNRDKDMIDMIASTFNRGVYDLGGSTTLRELAYLLSLSRLLITNDSAPLHMASAAGIPVVAIFGPTDPAKYGPVSEKSVVIRRGIDCSPCEKAQCRLDLECMRQITPEEVFAAAVKILDDLPVEKRVT